MKALAISLFVVCCTTGCDDASVPPPGSVGNPSGDNPHQNPLGCNPDGPCPNGTLTGGAGGTTSGAGGTSGSGGMDAPDAGSNDDATVSSGGVGGDNGSGGFGGLDDAGGTGGSGGSSGGGSGDDGGLGGSGGIGENGGPAGSGGAGGLIDGGAGSGGSGGFGGSGGADAGTTDGPAPCHRTRGYWLNHPDKWPTGHLTLGTNIYFEDQMLAILERQTQGNGLVSLAAQLIAAKLNSGTLTDLETQADVLIGDLVIPPIGDGYLPPSATSALTTLLDSYNQANDCQ